MNKSPQGLEDGALNWCRALLVGVVSGLLFGLIVGVWSKIQWPSDSNGWAGWVQAFGSIAAVVGATGVAIWNFRANVKIEHLRQEEARIRQMRAAFITLPMDLALVLRYAVKCSQIVQRKVEAPEKEICLDEGIFLRIREDIVSFDDDIFNMFAGMASFYQTQNARFNAKFFGGRNITREILLFDCVRLHMGASSLLDFARRDNGDICKTMHISYFGRTCFSLGVGFEEMLPLFNPIRGDEIFPVQDNGMENLRKLGESLAAAVGRTS